MSIDTRPIQKTSRYSRVIDSFSKIRDSFDKALRALELLRAVDQLYTDDREFLDEKLDDMKVRAEEIRIEKLKKPEHTPPATKLSSDIADNLAALRELDAAAETDADCEDVLLDHWWLKLKPGDIVHCKDKQHNYHTLSVIRNDGCEMCLQDNYSGINSLWGPGHIMLHLAPKRELLRRKIPCDMRFI